MMTHWSSGPPDTTGLAREPCVLAMTIWEYVTIRRNGKALSMPHLHLDKYRVDGWPAQLRYVEPSKVRKFMEWFQETQHTLRDRRADAATSRDTVAQQ